MITATARPPRICPAQTWAARKIASAMPACSSTQAMKMKSGTESST